MRKSAFILLLVAFSACNGLKSIKGVFKETSPYQKYLKSLETANLTGTAMFKKWKAAADSVLRDSVFIEAPFVESGFFAAEEPEARSYRISFSPGQELRIRVNTTATTTNDLFLDFFQWKDNEWKLTASADSTMTLNYEFENSGNGMIRLQPALLSNAYYTIEITKTPVLTNPVLGATNRSIQSFYGNPRDGGRRSHEGVDIFAARGTPVVAPAKGFVSRVGNNRLGGKVVWMRDSKRGHSYYFAHLDSQLVNTGQHVSIGDTLGHVGNTGNAINTPPHLHFGIYRSGSKDPLSYIFMTPQTAPLFAIDSVYLNQPLRVGVRRANLRKGRGENFEIATQLPKNAYIKVCAQSGDWWRIMLPDKKQYYIYKTLVEEIGPIKSLSTTGAQQLLTEASMKAVPKQNLGDSSKLNVLAYYEDYQYVETEEGKVGWVRGD